MVTTVGSFGVSLFQTRGVGVERARGKKYGVEWGKEGREKRGVMD